MNAFTGWLDAAAPLFASAFVLWGAPVTWLGLLPPFVLAASIGAPVFALWVARGFRARTAEASSGHRR